MSSEHLLRGSCFCGRNQYVVQIPRDSAESVQVLFDSNPAHRIASASPLSAFIRVPLSWYHSRTFPFFPDETRSGIRRIYSHPAEQHVLRHFCGFCGTPLSYWSESPRSEADFIQLTLGSLLTDDLHGLEDIGLIPAGEDEAGRGSTQTVMPRSFVGIPWFDALLAGSKLGSVQTRRGVEEHGSGRIRVEWEVTEWTEGGHDEEEENAELDDESSANAIKRKRAGHDDTSPGAVLLRRIA